MALQYLQTLSSLALVFALHHYKPTPLYVMDEIDAALGKSFLLWWSSSLFLILFMWSSSRYSFKQYKWIARFQECFHCWALCEGQDKGCSIYNYKARMDALLRLFLYLFSTFCPFNVITKINCLVNFFLHHMQPEEQHVWVGGSSCWYLQNW